MTEKYQTGTVTMTKDLQMTEPNIRLKYLVTIRKASAITGSSVSFFKQLIREKKLVSYRINSATFVSLVEFERLAIPSKT